jgi:radical SAM protein with 4Fe4S-binding SPASM domain
MAHVRSLFFKGPLADVENKAVTAFKLGRPSDIIWNITNRCNLLCDHCYMAADAHSLPEELTDEETIALVHQMGERGLPALFLSGGEPMMRKNFWEILELARSYDIRVTVSTNCTLINRESAKRLKANGIDWIATSLYGPDEFHDQMVRVPGTRKRVIEAIKILREEGVGVAIKTAISQETWPHVYDLIAETKALDCGLIYFCDLITAGRSEGEDDGRITAEQWRELGDFIVEDILSEESKLEWDIGAMPSFIPYVAEKFVERGLDVSNGLERLKVISACPVGKGHMNINSEGGIMPCQFAQDWTIGNVREMSLQDAVGQLYELDQQEAKGVCSTEACEYSRICRGCRAKAWQRTGDPMAEDVTCLLHAEFDRTALVERIEAAPEFARSAPCSVPGACG